jgi:glucose/arabinose dehydrogenase/acetamidase/formamidase
VAGLPVLRLVGGGHASARIVGLLAFALLAASPAGGQESIGLPVPPLGEGPWVFDTAEQGKIRVSVVARGLSHPWAIAWLPDGGMLVTERPGRLRVVRDGRLDPRAIPGAPEVRTDGNGGLMDVALHPDFAENGLVYLTYTKPVGGGRGAPALARGRLAGGVLTEVHDLVVTEAFEGNSGLNGRVAFGRDGKVYMSTGGRVEDAAQDPMSLRGKVLRLNDDGSVPSDNPFVGRAGYRPEIYTLGHRNTLGLIRHPVTGELWQHENGPNGGDELNVLRSGANYGWPLVSDGRDYSGAPIPGHGTRAEMESPLVVWLPSIAVAGMAVYTGDRFPAWRGNVFVGSLREGGIPGTGHLERIVFNERTEELRRESMLTEFRQRIREVRQGPDGLLYVLTDEEEDGALLRIEPSSSDEAVEADHFVPSRPETVSWGWYPIDKEPVLRMRSGETVRINTLTHAGATQSEEPVAYLTGLGIPREEILQDMLDFWASREGRPREGRSGHVITGPIYVEGAEPGDMLEVQILALETRLPWGINNTSATGGVFSPSYPGARPDDPLLDIPPGTLHVIRTGEVDGREVALISPDIQVPLAPFMGILAVAPDPVLGQPGVTEPGVQGSRPPGAFGGNLDVKDLTAGTTLYLPVFHPGALFYVGDPHGAQGDGEVSGTAIEQSLTGTFRLIVHKGVAIAGPRAETDTHYLIMGIDLDLDRAMRQATWEVVDFLGREKGLTPAEALSLASIAVDFRVSEVVDLTQVVTGFIPKSIFRR